MSNLSARLGAATVLLFAAAIAAAAPRVDSFATNTFSLRVFRDSDGLPQNTIQAIALGPSGRLWVGTQDGAAFYNGRTWTTVNLPDRSRASNFVRALLAAPDGTLWIGTRSNGLYRLGRGRWTHFVKVFQRSGRMRINALLATRSTGGGPVIWVGTYGGGVGRLENGTWRFYTTAEGLPSDRVWALGATSGPAGAPTVWAGTEDGTAFLRPRAGRFEIDAAFPPVSTNSFLVTRDRSGQEILWAGTYGHGLFRRGRGGWSRLTRADGLPNDYLTSLTSSVAPDGRVTVWAGSDGGGLAAIRGDAVRVIGQADGLPSAGVYALLATTAAQGADALWIGTRNGGLVRLMEGKWHKVWPAGCQSFVPVEALAETREPDGSTSVWIGTDGKGLLRLHGGHWSTLDRASGWLPSDTVQCLLATPDRSLWVGTRNGGLVRIAGRKKAVSTRSGGALPSNMVQCLLEIRERGASAALLVGTRDGLARFRNGSWQKVGPAEGLPSESVTALLASHDASGAPVVWAGVGGKLALRDRRGWRVLGPETGLFRGPVQCLMTRRVGGRMRLWVGTDGGGITVLDVTGAPRRLFAITAADAAALPNDVIYAMVEDHAGRIYVLTNRGVARLTPRKAAPASAADFDVHVDTSEDGLPLSQCNHGAALVDAAGRIWVGTVGGAAVLDPSSTRPDATPKRLVLTARLANGAGRLVPGTRLPFAKRRVAFRFTLLSFFRGGDTRYRTQLVGLDREPSPWAGEDHVEYRSLPAGSYRFRVWGRDYAGNITGPAELAFVVLPPPWQSWWAVLLAAALVALAFYGLLRLRFAAHRRRENQLRDLVAARTRELAEANEQLRRLSYADPLTGLANRRRFDEALESEWNRSQRTGKPLSVILVDIDNFKTWNDTFGHQAGDRYLVAVAGALTESTPRAADFVARIGGDEFAILLPETDLEGAATVAEAVREKVSNIRLAENGDQGPVPATVSCGVAASSSSPPSAAALLEVADQCLYTAKKAGRNRVVSRPEQT